MHPFKNLLLISVGRESAFEQDPTPKVWNRLYQMAHQQTLVGILNDAVHRIPEKQLPREDLLREWDENTDKICRIYHTQDRKSVV